MKVLVSTTEQQGRSHGDYQGTVDGELLAVRFLDCDCPGCGCNRGFPGLASSRATTTALVVERPEMTKDDLRAAVHDSLERGGWFRYVEDPNEIDEMVDEIIDEIVAACARFDPGTVLGRDRSFVFARATAAA